MSNQKTAKKVRQVFRKQKQAFWSGAFKPKPKWIPWRVWKFGLSIFLKLE